MAYKAPSHCCPLIDNSALRSPGGNPSLRPVEANSAVPRPCGNGMWTQFEGAHEPSMCRKCFRRLLVRAHQQCALTSLLCIAEVPPGYKMGPQWLTECANGEFREVRSPHPRANTCMLLPVPQMDSHLSPH